MRLCFPRYVCRFFILVIFTFSCNILIGENKYNQKWAGLSSRPLFLYCLAYLTKMNLKTSRLPNKFYTIGQQYVPSKFLKVVFLIFICYSLLNIFSNVNLAPKGSMTTTTHGLLACPQKYAVCHINIIVST